MRHRTRLKNPTGIRSRSCLIWHFALSEHFRQKLNSRPTVFTMQQFSRRIEMVYGFSEIAKTPRSQNLFQKSTELLSCSLENSSTLVNQWKLDRQRPHRPRSMGGIFNTARNSAQCASSLEFHLFDLSLKSASWKCMPAASVRMADI